jgi:predicted Holliday junction resolvase-like endonuclease
MQTIIAAIVFGLILIAVIVMIVIYLAYKGVRKIKQEAEDNYYRSQKRKEQKEKNPFGDDYFKSASSKKQRAKSQYQPRQEPFQEKVRQEQPKEDTARSTTTTSSGVTIIDDRGSDEKRKIFERSDDEYVEFEEV